MGSSTKEHVKKLDRIMQVRDLKRIIKSLRNDLEISFDVYSDKDGVNQVDLLIDDKVVYSTTNKTGRQDVK